MVDNKRGKLDFGVLRRLRRYMRKFRADLLHGFLYDGNIYARVAAIGSGVPVLNSERSDDYVLRPSQVWPHRLTKHLADGVVANTRTGRDFAQRLFGLPDHRMVIVIGLKLNEFRVVESGVNRRDQEVPLPEDRDEHHRFADQPSSDLVTRNPSRRSASSMPPWRSPMVYILLRSTPISTKVCDAS